MKLRRMKLVALAMSALMVTSALPMTAFAEEEVFYEEVADEALVGESDDLDLYIEDEAEDADFIVEEDYEEEEVVGDDKPATELAPETITFYYNDDEKPDFLVEYRLKDLNTGNVITEGDPETAKADIYTDEGKGTCKETVVLKVTLFGKVYYSKKFEIEDDDKHNWKIETNYNTDDTPTCDDGGTGKETKTCTVCGKTETTDITVDKLGHDWGEAEESIVDSHNLVTNKRGEVVFTNGKPTLINADEDGWYDVARVQTCKRDKSHTRKVDKDGKETTEDERVVVYATKEYERRVCGAEDFTNIVNNDDFYAGMSAKDIPSDYKKIELEDCSKDGLYYVVSFNANGLPIGRKPVVVPAHHVLGDLAIEFKNAADKAQCTVEMKNGVPTGKVINNNCSRDITYYEVYHCVATSGKCKLKKCDTSKYVCEHRNDREASRVERQTGKGTNHSINTGFEAQVDALKDASGNVKYSDLETLAYGTSDKKTPYEKAKDNGTYVYVEEGTATCEAPGEAVLKYICKICGETVAEKKVKVLALGHDPEKPEIKITKDATCYSEGSYDATIYCARCKKALSETRNIAIPTTDHTNQKYNDKKALIDFVGKVVVDFNGSIDKGDVDSWSFGMNPDYEAGIHEDYSVSAEVFTTCDVCGWKNVNHAAEYEIKVDDIEKSQYSCLAGSITLTATYERADRSVVSVTKTFPYYTSINAYQARSQHDPETQADGTVKCKVCGTIIKEGSGEDPTDHTHVEAEAVIENLKDATCTEAGSYDLVTKCKDCGEVIKTMHVLTPATGHNYGAWQTSKKATVFTTGTQKRTCALCKNAETRSIAKLPSIIKLNKTAVTVKVGKSATVKVSKWNLKDYIAPTAEGGVKANNKNVSAFKTGSYTLKIKGKKAGSSTVTVKMKAGATATIKVTVKK